MSRVAILPALDDGFAIAYWMRNFATWDGLVDRLLILIIGEMSAEIEVTHPKVEVMLLPTHLAHGSALELLVAASDEDHILFCEDDAYIRRPDALSEAFAAVESGDYDLSGSPREMASQELLNASAARWGKPSAGDDYGNGLWPAFLVIRRDVLAQTNGKLDATLWNQGDVVPGLDHVVTGETASDETMVATTWQLRKLGVKMRLVPQYRVADGGTLDHYIGIDPPWFHVGSLSSGYGLYRGQHTYGVQHGRDYPEELTRRMSWWRRFADTAPPSEQRTRYESAISDLQEAVGIRDKDVARWHDRYQPLINWAER